MAGRFFIAFTITCLIHCSFLKMFAKHFKNRNIQDVNGGKSFLSKVLLLPIPSAILDPLFLTLATSSFMTNNCLSFAITLVLFLQQWKITLDYIQFEKVLDL